jgi:hypothetical protein
MEGFLHVIKDLFCVLFIGFEIYVLTLPPFIHLILTTINQQ